MEELKPCPFCGYTGAKVQSKERGFYWLRDDSADIRVDDASYYVACNRCKARSSVVSGRFIGCIDAHDVTDPFGESETKTKLPPVYRVTTRQEVTQRAIDAWNRRVSDG